MSIICLPKIGSGTRVLLFLLIANTQKVDDEKFAGNRRPKCTISLQEKKVHACVEKWKAHFYTPTTT